jgi:hypothetical protein
MDELQEHYMEMCKDAGYGHSTSKKVLTSIYQLDSVQTPEDFDRVWQEPTDEELDQIKAKLGPGTWYWGGTLELPETA